MRSSFSQSLRPLAACGLLLMLCLMTGGNFAGAQEAAPAAGDVAAAGPADNATAAPAPGRSPFWWLIETSGEIGLVLLVISLYFVAKVTQCFLELREPVMIPPAFIAKCNQLIANREFSALLIAAKAEDSQIGRVLATAFSGLSIGIAEAREAVDRGADTLAVNLETKISMLAVIGSLGPMIGLLGTLKGMISSFYVIALSDQQMKASQVAGGISEALILTFEGVALSVPAIYFFAFFRNRVANLTVAVQNTADDIVKRVYLAAKSSS
ncbi:MAG: biopolymer transporter ExbB [Planctomyces sp.]|nr:biopolymer transporter ExbB [Planctomyces sp.]